MKKNKYLYFMEKYAKDHDVPIIEHDGLKIVLEQLQINEVKTVLEVGSAIGYSAIQFHLQNNCLVTTIERDDKMYEQAVSNVGQLGLEEKITIIHDDALLYDDSQLGIFDCLYIDGAKSQYLKFLEKYISHLRPGGVVIFDNLLFHGYVFSDTVQSKSRNLKQLVRKLETFINKMNTSDQYTFHLIEEGDGIGVLYRRGEEDEK